MACMGVIVVATDGSPAAEAALDEAIALAGATGDSIAAVTVWQALQGDYGLAYPPAAVLSDLLEAERQHAEATLARAADRARATGIAVETQLLTGDPAERVCDLAEERDARMIVMGTHGYGAMVTLFVGSVSGAVIRRARCPVLVVHAPTGTEPTLAEAG